MSVSNMNQSSNMNSTLRLDESARQNVLAKAQQQTLQSIGLLKGKSNSDQMSLSPLKGLLSAAAGSYMQSLKKNSESAKLGKGLGGFGDLSAIRKQIEAELAASAKDDGKVSGAAGTTITLGGTSGSGSSTVKPQAADKILSGAIGAVLNAGGSVKDNRDGSYTFQVGDFQGTIAINDDTVYGTAGTGKSSVYFKKNTAGDEGYSADGSESADDNLNVKRIQTLLAGDVAGLKSLTSGTGAVESPADPADPVDPADEGGVGGGGSVPADTEPAATGDGGTAVAAPAAPVAEEPVQAVDEVLTTVMGVSTPGALAALLTGGSSSDKAKANAKLYIEDLKTAGATFTGAARNKVSFTLNGVKGSIEIKSDRVEGKYGSGKAEVKVRIENDGEVKLDGDDKNALAKMSSNLLRHLMGKSGSGATKQEFNAARYNRSGAILNLLG